MSALDDLIRTNKRDAAFYADDKQLELIDYAANELEKLREEIEDAKQILMRLAYKKASKMWIILTWLLLRIGLKNIRSL
jgi:hypothetical protein